LKWLVYNNGDCTSPISVLCFAATLKLNLWLHLSQRAGKTECNFSIYMICIVRKRSTTTEVHEIMVFCEQGHSLTETLFSCFSKVKKHNLISECTPVISFSDNTEDPLVSFYRPQVWLACLGHLGPDIT
jgi:hypothetical protein